MASDAAAMGGAIASVAGRGKAAGAVGGLVEFGAVTALTARYFNDRKNAAESVALFPETHLFHVPFSVPPGLFAKRWIVLYGPTPQTVGCVVGAIINYDLGPKGQERVSVRLRNPGSQWQRSVCLHKAESDSDS